MIGEVMQHINNFFIRTSEDTSAVFTASNKKIAMEYSNDLIAGQYIKIEGSVLNDGVYKVASILNDGITVVESILDETADITISGLAPSKDFISLVTKIQTDVNAGKYSDVSEIKRGDTTIKYGDGSSASWEDDYKKSLAPYTKLKVV